VVPCIPSLPSLKLPLAEEAEDLEVETLDQQVFPIKVPLQGGDGGSRSSSGGREGGGGGGAGGGEDAALLGGGRPSTQVTNKARYLCLRGHGTKDPRH
jgi:hypothetical protein